MTKDDKDGPHMKTTKNEAHDSTEIIPESVCKKPALTKATEVEQSVLITCARLESKEEARKEIRKREMTETLWIRKRFRIWYSWWARWSLSRNPVLHCRAALKIIWSCGGCYWRYFKYGSGGVSVENTISERQLKQWMKQFNLKSSLKRKQDLGILQYMSWTRVDSWEGIFQRKAHAEGKTWR